MAGGLTHPSATVSLLSVNDRRPLNTPRLVILHTNGGSLSSGGANLKRYIESQLAAQAEDPSVKTPTQPHHQVDLNGELWQFLEYNRKGVGSVRAEGFCITVETQDYGSKATRPDGSAWPIEDQPWTPEQVETLAQVCANAHLVFGIPLRRSDAWNGSGIDHHTRWGAPSPWTLYYKTCPGAARIAQVDTIIHRAREIVLPPLPPASEEDDVKYLWLICPGRPEVIMAMDGAGITIIGLATGADANALGTSFGAVRTNVTPGQFDEIVARAGRTA